MISTEPKEYVIRVLKGDMNLLYQEFWALKNVSLKKKVINWDSWFEWCRKKYVAKTDLRSYETNRRQYTKQR